MSKHTVKICDRCHGIVAYKESLFSRWTINEEFIETQHWYNGADFTHEMVVPIASQKPYHICLKCLNKGWEKNFEAIVKCFKEIDKHNKSTVAKLKEVSNA